MTQGFQKLIMPRCFTWGHQVVYDQACGNGYEHLEHSLDDWMFR